MLRFYRSKYVLINRLLYRYAETGQVDGRAATDGKGIFWRCTVSAYMPAARLVSTDGPYLEAFIELDGQILCVMDEFTWNGAQAISSGDPVNIRLEPMFKEDEPWDSMFRGNPDHRIGVERITGWAYRAFGRIVSVNPVEVDIGLLITDSPISTHDERAVGEFVAFTIERLTASREN